MSYKVVRFYFRDLPRRTIATGLTREQAEAHCKNPETSSRTCKRAVKTRRLQMYLTIEHDKHLADQGWASLDQSEKAVYTAREEWGEVLTALIRVTRLPSWSHVRALSQYGEGVTLYLDSEHKDSPLPREIAQEFHAKGIKEPGEGTLSVYFEMPRFHLTVAGYLPPSCRVEYVTEWIPAHEGRVPKVVCTGGGEDEG